MCSHGTSTILRVNIPAHLSYSGEARWDDKPVDSCIAPIVDALNKAGILTSGCCCGHGKGPGEILLQDGRVLTLPASPHKEPHR